MIGAVIAEPVYRVTEGDRVVAEFPGSQTRHRLPVYTPDAREDPARCRPRAMTDVRADRDHGRRSAIPAWTLSRLLAIPDDREQGVGHAAVRYVGADQHRRVAGRRRRGRRANPRNVSERSRLKTDGNGRYTYLDPRVGGRIAVAEAARNVACVGARPMAITNCLNFGNPTRPEVYYQLREAIARHGRGLPSAGHPGHRRQRFALQ